MENKSQNLVFSLDRALYKKFNSNLAHNIVGKIRNWRTYEHKIWTPLENTLENILWSIDSQLKEDLTKIDK
jgi:hypothetical protein